MNGLGLEDLVWPRVREVGAAAWAILVIVFSFRWKCFVLFFVVGQNLIFCIMFFLEMLQ